MMGITYRYREFHNVIADDSGEHALSLANSNAATVPATPGPETHVTDHTTLTIVLSVAGGVALLVIIVAAVFFRLYLKKRRERQKMKAKYDIYTTIPRHAHLSMVNTQRQLTQPYDTHPIATYNSMDLVPERPQIEVLELLKNEENSKRYHQKLYKFHSFEKSQPTKRHTKHLRRTKSATSLDTEGLAPCDISEVNVRIAFSLKYVKNLRQVNLKLHSFSELPTKAFGYDVFAVVYLFPRNKDGVNSRNIKGDKSVKLEQTFLFDDLTMCETEKSTLRIALFYRKKQKSTKEEFLGELFLKCSEVDWSLAQPVRFEMEVNKNRAKRESTSDKYLFQDLGSLFVCLEYQSAAKRMKVMVRKACNLPKSDRLIGRPGHYVIVSLLKNKDLVKSQETRTQSGHIPVWNQPFLFDLPGDNVNDYSFDFVVMRGKFRTKDGVVGHVVVGEDSTRDGTKHWKDILSPRPSETVRWHTIMPVFNFKSKIEPSKLNTRKDS